MEFTVRPEEPIVKFPAPAAMVKSASRLMAMPATLVLVLIVALDPPEPNIKTFVPLVMLGAVSPPQFAAVLMFEFAPPPSQMVLSSAMES